MKNAALLALLLLNSAALAQVDAGATSEVNTALIWGGGKTAKSAEAARDRWTETAMVARAHVALADGYPKVVKSETVKGLNPGLFVTLLGMCREDEAQRFVGAMQGMGPGAYAKKVAPVPTSECPKLLQAKSTLSATSKLKDSGSVSAAVFH